MLYWRNPTDPKNTPDSRYFYYIAIDCKKLRLRFGNDFNRIRYNIDIKISLLCSIVLFIAIVYDRSAIAFLCFFSHTHIAHAYSMQSRARCGFSIQHSHNASIHSIITRYTVRMRSESSRTIPVAMPKQLFTVKYCAHFLQFLYTIPFLFIVKFVDVHAIYKFCNPIFLPAAPRRAAASSVATIHVLNLMSSLLNFYCSPTCSIFC